jgi:hypothetical protein
MNSTPNLPKDLAAVVELFYKIVKAADEFEAYMALHSSVTGTGRIQIGIADEEVAAEMIRLVNALQERLAPYRAAIGNLDNARNN